jgi:hypothetical protein
VRNDRAEPDPVWMHRERRRKRVTLELLQLEYLSGIRQISLHGVLRPAPQWLSRQRVVMRRCTVRAMKALSTTRAFVRISSIRARFESGGGVISQRASRLVPRRESPSCERTSPC